MSVGIVRPMLKFSMRKIYFHSSFVYFIQLFSARARVSARMPNNLMDRVHSAISKRFSINPITDIKRLNAFNEGMWSAGYVPSTHLPLPKHNQIKAVCHRKAAVRVQWFHLTMAHRYNRRFNFHSSPTTFHLYIKAKLFT